MGIDLKADLRFSLAAGYSENWGIFLWGDWN